jgi:hypothetical protein
MQNAKIIILHSCCNMTLPPLLRLLHAVNLTKLRTYTINPVSCGRGRRCLSTIMLLLLLGGGVGSPRPPARSLGRLGAGLTPGLAGSSLSWAALTVRLLATPVNL